MRRLVLLLVLAAGVLVAAAAMIGVMPSFWPRSPEPDLRTIILPTHTGYVEASDTFLGQPNNDGDCFYFFDDTDSRILPIWPPGYYGKLTRPGVRPFLGIWRPEDPDNNPFNARSEILELHGERVTAPYDELRSRLRTEVPEACRHYSLFLVAEAIQRS